MGSESSLRRYLYALEWFLLCLMVFIWIKICFKGLYMVNEVQELERTWDSQLQQADGAEWLALAFVPVLLVHLSHLSTLQVYILTIGN